MNLKELKKFVEKTPIVGHNLQFESRWLLKKGINPKIVEDTKLLAYLYDERLPLDLESLCLRFEIDRVFKKSHGLEVTKIEGEELRVRNAKDARNTILLRNKIKPLLSKEELKLYEEVFLPASKSLAKIECAGICVDITEIRTICKEIDARIESIGLEKDDLIQEFQRSNRTAFNIDSPVHRGIVVYGLLGYEPFDFPQAKTDTGAPSTGIKILRQLQLKRYSETLDKIIQVSALSGWKEKYEKLFDNCDKCGGSHIYSSGNSSGDFIYTGLYLGETTTGRVRSDHPNMQNIPKKEGGEWTRKCFTSRFKDGVIVEADYSGIELRILAALSGDEKLLEAFYKSDRGKGEDVHVCMAREAFGITGRVSDDERFRGKTLNYAIPFGRGKSGVAFDTGVDIETASGWLRRYWKNHPRLKEYLNNIPESGIVISPTGMKRHCNTWTEGKNFPIQNTALVVMLTALNRTIWNLPQDWILDLVIHDSFRFDVKKFLTKYVNSVKMKLEFEAGEFAPWLNINLPVEIKVGRNWGEMKKW